MYLYMYIYMYEYICIWIWICVKVETTPWDRGLFVCHCGTFPEVEIFRRALGSISNAKVVYINRLNHFFPGP